MNSAQAQEADVPEPVPATEVTVDEPEVNEEGVGDRLKHAWKYITKGDSTEIVSQTEAELQTRSEELAKAEAEFARRTSAFVHEKEKLSEVRNDLIQRGNKLAEIQSRLTNCLAASMQEVQDVPKD